MVVVMCRQFCCNSSSHSHSRSLSSRSSSSSSSSSCCCCCSYNDVRGELAVPRYRLTTAGRRGFSFAGPSAWNNLPTYL